MPMGPVILMSSSFSEESRWADFIGQVGWLSIGSSIIIWWKSRGHSASTSSWQSFEPVWLRPLCYYGTRTGYVAHKCPCKCSCDHHHHHSTSNGAMWSSRSKLSSSSIASQQSNCIVSQMEQWYSKRRRDPAFWWVAIAYSWRFSSENNLKNHIPIAHNGKHAGVQEQDCLQVCFLWEEERFG